MPLPIRLGARVGLLSAMLTGCGVGLSGCTAGGAHAAGIAATAQPGGGQQMGEMLVGGIKATEGALDALAFQLPDGRFAIIAWFENKSAAMRWYHNPIHRQLMGGLNAGDAAEEPMAHIDEETPIMVLASITPAEPGVDYGLGMPFKQIAIELFTSLPGGAEVNGRLSPDAFPVEHMRHFQAVRQDK